MVGAGLQFPLVLGYQLQQSIKFMLEQMEIS
jgi:hypothetical protein